MWTAPFGMTRLRGCLAQQPRHARPKPIRVGDSYRHLPASIGRPINPVNLNGREAYGKSPCAPRPRRSVSTGNLLSLPGRDALWSGLTRPLAASATHLPPRALVGGNLRLEGWRLP